jgi:hypothetical protein
MMERISTIDAVTRLSKYNGKSEEQCWEGQRLETVRKRQRKSNRTKIVRTCNLAQTFWRLYSLLQRYCKIEPMHSCKTVILGSMRKRKREGAKLARAAVPVFTRTASGTGAFLMSNTVFDQTSAPRAPASRACDTCRLRKIRCDGAASFSTNIAACSRCDRLGLSCTFDIPSGKRGPKRSVSIFYDALYLHQLTKNDFAVKEEMSQMARCCCMGPLAPRLQIICHPQVSLPPYFPRIVSAPESFYMFSCTTISTLFTLSFQLFTNLHFDFTWPTIATSTTMTSSV